MKDIKNLSLDELKTIAYDLIVARVNATSQLNIVNQMIANKSKETSQVEKPKIKSK